MGTEPAPSPPASCQSPPDLHGLPGREEGLCQKAEGLKSERKEGVLPQGLGTPRCLGAPTGGSVLWESGGGRPCSQEPGPAAPALGSSSVCLGQFPAGCPLHLPMEPDAALGKIPSGVCCLSPPSRHPRWRRCVRINGKSLHKYLEKSKREKGEKNSLSGMPWGHLGAGHRQMGEAGHQHSSPCRRPQREPPGPGLVRAAGTAGLRLRGEARPAWVTSRSHGTQAAPSCHVSITHNRASKLSLGTSLRVERRLQWLRGAPGRRVERPRGPRH